MSHFIFQIEIMLTGAIRNQIDAIWNAFWSGGVSNPLSVIEQITYLLFIKGLDDLHTREEAKAQALGRPMERRIFPEGADDKGRPYEDLRWSRFKNFEAREMFTVVDEHVFPFLRTLGETDGSLSRHMREARLGLGRGRSGRPGRPRGRRRRRSSSSRGRWTWRNRPCEVALAASANLTLEAARQMRHALPMEGGHGRAFLSRQRARGPLCALDADDQHFSTCRAV